MPSFAYSIARCWVIVSRPPLVIIGTAAGTPRIGLRARAAVIVTMLPPVFCASICLTASWVTYRKPWRFVETSDLKSSAVYSVNGLVKKMPALLTRASIDWKRDSAASTTLAAVAGSPMWPSTRATRSDAATSADWVTVREVATTLKPRSTNAFTMPAPIPCEAPVTMAVFRWLLMVVTSKKAMMGLLRDALLLLLLRQLLLQLADAVLKLVDHGLNLPLCELLLGVLGAVNVPGFDSEND